MERASTHDPTIGSLLKGILTDVQTLIREEIALARVELTEQVVNAQDGCDPVRRLQRERSAVPPRSC